MVYYSPSEEEEENLSDAERESRKREHENKISQDKTYEKLYNKLKLLPKIRLNILWNSNITKLVFSGEMEDEIDFWFGDYNTRHITTIANFLKVNTSIHTLVLERIPLSETATVNLAESFKVNTTLRIVKLATCNIFRKGLRALGRAFKENTGIHTLDLSENPGKAVGDRDNFICMSRHWDELLEAFKINRSLRNVILQHNQLGGTYLGDFTQAMIENKGIRMLDISYNALNYRYFQDIVEILVGNSTLRTLRFLDQDCNYDPYYWNSRSYPHNYREVLLTYALKKNMTVTSVEECESDDKCRRISRRAWKFLDMNRKIDQHGEKFLTYKYLQSIFRPFLCDPSRKRKREVENGLENGSNSAKEPKIQNRIENIHKETCKGRNRGQLIKENKQIPEIKKEVPDMEKEEKNNNNRKKASSNIPSKLWLLISEYLKWEDISEKKVGPILANNLHLLNSHSLNRELTDFSFFFADDEKDCRKKLKGEFERQTLKMGHITTIYT